jgi:vacuolar protein sorting-associated protein 1
MKHNEFYDKTLEELQQAMKTDQNVLQFSKNMIQVEVKDPEPELTDLSFIDLPGASCASFCDITIVLTLRNRITGLIQNSDADVINLVREVVELHIGGQNTVILVTIPMSGETIIQSFPCFINRS